MKKLLLVPLILALAGCGIEPEVQKARNQANAEKAAGSFAAPELVGTLPTKQPVYRVIMKYTDSNDFTREHFIYFVPGANSISDNWLEPEGKALVNRTATTINVGQATPEQIISIADKLRKEQDEKDRAEWERLKQKFQ